MAKTQSPPEQISAYHAAELAILRNTQDPRRAVPAYPCKGWRVLDIGCGVGQTLTAQELEDCAEHHGIDVDLQAICTGLRLFPSLHLVVAAAEALPYAAATFDLTFSRVALPYTNLPIAAREMFRVTRPGGAVWLALHDSSMEWEQLRHAIRTVNARSFLNRVYVMANSLLLATTGRCVPRPWSDGFESIQFERPMVRLLSGIGFTEIEVHHDSHFIICARR